MESEICEMSSIVNKLPVPKGLVSHGGAAEVFKVNTITVYSW
jgi:hypothetical protein